MDLLRGTKTAARSWCLVTHHRAGHPAEVLFGDPQEILGIPGETFSDATIAERVIGDFAGPCPWKTLADTTAYLVDVGAGRAQWVESSSVEAADGGLLMSTRPMLPGDSEQLLAIARLSQGGSLLGPLSHELNNVVQGLSSAEYLLRDCLENGDPIEIDDVNQLAEVIQHLKFIGAQLQAFARVDLTAIATVQLQAVLTRSMELLQSMGRLGLVELELDISESLPDLQWRPAEINFLIVALLSNAVEASLLGDDSALVRITARAVDGAIELEVRNSGARLEFETDSLPGTTSKNRSRHLGFGLSVAREIVARRGGRLVVADGTGTGLRVTLPLGPTEAAA